MGLSLNLQFSQLIKHVNIYIGSWVTSFLY
jgi:hypothetical protein